MPGACSSPDAPPSNQNDSEKWLRPTLQGGHRVASGEKTSRFHLSASPFAGALTRDQSRRWNALV